MHSSSSAVPLPRIISLTAGVVIAALVMLGLMSPQGPSYASGTTPTPPTLSNIVAEEQNRLIEVSWVPPNDTSDLEGYAFRVSTDNVKWHEPAYPDRGGSESYVSASSTIFDVMFGDDGNQIKNWVAYYLEISPVLKSDNTLRNWQSPTGGPFTPQKLPGAPDVSAAVPSGKGETLRVSWTTDPLDDPGGPEADPNGISGFQVALLLEGDKDFSPDDPLDPNPWADPLLPLAGDCFGTLGGSVNTCDIEDLVAGQGYYVAVRAENSAGFGDWGVYTETTGAATEAQVVTPTLSLPTAPTITSVSGGDAEATVTVDRGTGGGAPADFTITANPGSETCTVTGTSGSCTVPNLTNGTSHTFTAVANNATGVSPVSSVSTAVTPVLSAPNAPSISGVSAGDGQVSVTVSRGTGGQPAFFTVESSPESLTCVISGSSSSCNVTGLTNGTAYIFTATATNAAGTSNASSPSSSVTPTLSAPGVPVITGAVAGNEQATVSVSAGAGGTPASYLVTASPDGEQCTVTGSAGSCTVSNLNNGTAYTFTATATNGAGTSQASTASTTVTPTVVVVTAPAPNSPGQGNQGTRRGLPAVMEIALPPRSTVTNFLAPVVTAPRPATMQPGSATLGQAPSQATTPSGNGQSAATSGPLATVGGQVVTVESSATSPTQLALQVGSVSLGVSVGNGSGTVGSNGSDANGSNALGIQLVNGAATTFEGGGLTPGSAVQVVLPLAGDNSAVLAVIEVAEDGTFLGEAAFSTTPDGDPLPIGVRVVQLFTVDEDGNDVVIEVAVTIGQPDPTPAINRADGSVPTLTPGEALGTSAGLPQVIEVRAIEEQKRAVVDGGAWSMAVDVASSTGGVQSVDSGAQLTLVRDESAMVSGSGFMPGTRADVWLFSEPTLLGTVTVDENGEFVGEVTIDGIVIPAGEHTLQLQGVGQDGYVKATSLGVAVDDVTAPMPSDTTSSSLWMLLLAIGGLAILLIAVFVIAVRRQMRKQ